MSQPDIRSIESAEALRACFPVMRELRPHLADERDFAERVARMRDERYALLAVWEGDAPVALAGYRFQENLIYGRVL